MDTIIRTLLDLPADEQVRVLDAADTICRADGVSEGTALIRALNAHKRVRAEDSALPTTMNPAVRAFLLGQR